MAFGGISPLDATTQGVKSPNYRPAPSWTGVVSGGALLRQGHAGPAVAELQRQLNKAGVPVATDGFFGPMTFAAVRELQAMYGLKTSGTADRSVISLLQNPAGHTRRFERKQVVRNFLHLPDLIQLTHAPAKKPLPAAPISLAAPPGSGQPAIEVFPVAGKRYNMGWDKEWNHFDNASHSPHHNSDFYTGSGPNGHERGHLGIDIFGPRGTPILAPVSGRVVSVAPSEGRGGNNVTIEKNGYRYYMAHLDTIAPGLTVGQTVTAGTPVGTLGSTGTQTAPHLHFSIYRGAYGNSINPFAALMAAHNRAAGVTP